MLRNAIILYLLFTAAQIPAQEVSVFFDIEIANGETDYDVMMYAPGHSYKRLCREKAEQFEVEFFRDSSSTKFVQKDSTGFFNIPAVDYDSIKISSGSQWIVVYDMPSFLLDSTRWKVVLNQSAPPYCIEYLLDYRWNSRRLHVSHCNCCQQQNHLLISFPRHKRYNYNLSNKLSIYKREKLLRPYDGHNTPFSFSYRNNCPYYFTKEFLWQEQQPFDREALKDMVEKKHWRLLGVSNSHYKSISFYNSGASHYLQNGNVYTPSRRYRFDEIGFYKISRDSLYRYDLHPKQDGSEGFIDYEYRIIAISEDYMLTEHVPNFRPFKKSPQIKFVRTLWENIGYRGNESQNTQNK